MSRTLRNPPDARYVPEIAPTTRSAAERVEVNTPIQETAADLIRKAMFDLARRLRDEKIETRLQLQMHDELVLGRFPGINVEYSESHSEFSR